MKLIDNSLSSFRIKGNLPQWGYWTIALVLFCLAWLAVMQYARWLAIRDLALTGDSWSDDGVLIQTTNYTCVPAALVMLLKDFGINVSTKDIAKEAGTDIFGTSAAGIFRVGKKYGFKVIRQKMDFSRFADTRLPGIILFRSKGIKHAAYLKYNKEFGVLEVKDPVDGLLKLNEQDAIKHFGNQRWEVFLFD